MKTVSKYFFLAVAACLSLTACESMMDLQPEGATKTDALKQDAYEKLPANAAADVNAIYAQMIELYAGGTTGHNDFGVASCMMILESEGQDWIGPNIGYNWFNYSDFYTRNANSTYGHAMWNVYYKIIRAANAVCVSIDEKTEDPTLKANLGQARAVRAYCYTILAQLYQFTYLGGNQDKPCVPIIHEKLTADQLANNPRATVQQVYDFVLSDLNYAISALDGFVRADKGAADQAVAYGLRARVNMLVGNFAEAAEDAKLAIQVSGAQPYTMAEVSKPTFCHAEANSVIWANMIVESNDVVRTGIVNWPSHMSSLYLDGYTGVGAYRSISSELYDKIPATDVRKGWWLNEELTSPLITNNAVYAPWAAYIEDGMQYVNVKFGVPNDNMVNLVADADWTMMRYEEMILIQAEGLARSGQEGAAKALLEDWVKTNRDPQYTVGLDILDEIWTQRRVELWGEGFAWFDLNRLEKPIKRTASSNWPAAWVIDVAADHACRIWVIPQAEIEANEGISEDDNNPVGNPFA